MPDFKHTLRIPTDLAPSRAVVHKAVQLLTAAAGSNLEAPADDSYSNFEWSPEKQAFLTHPLPVGQGACQVGLSPSLMMPFIICSEGSSRQLDLPGRSYGEALIWLDEQLDDEGILPASAAHIPYELPKDVAQIEVFPRASGLDFDALVAWCSLAVTAMTPLERSLGHAKPGPSMIRCWPHHFDIATNVALDDGDAEVARGIGMGLSPGDESYDQPYFYVNPWSHPKHGALPDPIAPGHWHTDAFVGAVATGEEVMSQTDICGGTKRFLQQSVDAGRATLSAK